jgi:hypothetical protein
MGTERTHKIDAAGERLAHPPRLRRWSAADQARLDQWLNASTLNRVAFLRLELAWEDAARLKALGAGIRGRSTAAPRDIGTLPPFLTRARRSRCLRGTTQGSKEPCSDPREPQSAKSPVPENTRGN